MLKVYSAVKRIYLPPHRMTKPGLVGLEAKKKSFWTLFRLIFVVFSLYLMGDAFSRWDGFSYYASFREFLPSVALASIIWSIVAAITALIIWLLLNVCDRLCKQAGLKFNSEHLLFCAGILLLSGAMIWKGKKRICQTATLKV